MRRKSGTILVSLMMVVLLGVAAYAGYQLYTSHRAYAQGDETYEDIAQQVIRTPTAQTASSESAPQTEGEAMSQETSGSQANQELNIPEREVDFAALCDINGDAIGWLYCPDTVIDYPVMEAEDYTYYLHHLPDGTYNINGSLFLDYNCQGDFSSEVSVIYGHNMKSGKMFGTLTDYKKQSYFDAHPYLYLYTPQRNYRIALIYGAVVSAQQWTSRGYAMNAEALIEYAQENTTFVSPVEYTGEEQLMVFSTCSYEFDDARYILVGLLQSES
jgi:sortase B